MNYSIGFKDGKIMLNFCATHPEYGKLCMEVEIPLINIMEIAAKATDNNIDDYIVEIVKKALNG